MTTDLDTSTKHPSVFKYLIAFNTITGLIYGLITALLALFLVQSFRLDPNHAIGINSSFIGLLFITPILTGYLAGIFGFVKTVIVGCLLSIVSFLFLLSSTPIIVYLGIGGVALSVSLYYPAYLVILGRHYTRHDIRRDSAFTISYMSMNAGIFLGAMFGGYISQILSYNYAFIIGSIISVVALIVFLAVIPKLQFTKNRKLDDNLRFKPLLGTGLFLSAIVVLLFVCGWLLDHSNITHYLMIAFVTIISITLLTYAVKQPSETRNKILTFFILAVIAMSFYICFSLEASLVTLFVQTSVQLNVIGMHISSASTHGLEPLFVVILAVPLAKMWIWLAKINKEPSFPAKFSLALLTMGCGYLIFVLAIFMNQDDQLIHIGWIVLGYLILSCADLMLMPVGNAMVGRLAPQKLEGVFMGTWQSFHGVSAAISAILVGLVVLPDPSASATIANPIYENAFLGLGMLTIFVGIIALILVPLINKILK
jgi:POT family proton-dependent oligopeptide transporter